LRSRLRLSSVVIVVSLLTLPVAAQTGPGTETVDYDAVYKIKDEGFQRSQVMEIASYLTDVYGPRLTGSPSFKQAADWAVKKLGEWGGANPRVESWGTFGRGWVNQRFSAHVVTGSPWPIIGMPKAWTPGTEGTVTADAVYAPLETDKDLEKWKGQLKGKIVLATPMREVKALFEPPAKRYTDAELKELETIEPRAAQRRQFDLSMVQMMRKRVQFLAEEGVLAIFEPGRGDGGTVFVQGGGAYNPNQPGFMGMTAPANVPPSVVIAVEHYGRIARTLEKKVPVSIELNIQNTFSENQEGYNVFAELPGTDKSDEVVMLGAHFDAWHGATGATDNAAGSAVMLEAFRILKQSGLKLRRTVRIGLWGGEEQGLLGSRAYVKAKFADRATMQLKAEHGKVAGYFNVDNGTGAIRGIYLQGNEAIVPIFGAWMKPFESLGMTILTLRNTGGTDHLAFDAVGIPGFQFVQDPVEYDTRTHHSNMDNYERLQSADMMKNAVIVAAFVYHTANRDAKLPRKPLPKPEPPQPQQPRPVPTAATR
jgi:carboxypeptidase Q